MGRILTLANGLFVILLIIGGLGYTGGQAGSGYLLALTGLLEVIYLLRSFLTKDLEKVKTAGDVTAVILLLLLVWQVVTAQLHLVDKMLFPAPGEVIALLIADLPELLKGLASSLELLAAGYFLALLVAIPLALFIGWRKRLYNMVNPFTKVLGPVPPIVYIPYAIALLPTFKASSIFVIFIGAFWPVFINTLSGVFNVEKRLVDTARALNVGEVTMLFRIILPGALPAIMSGATLGLVMSFILLTSAEMIGATSGLGWYVKNFSDFADYPRVIVGIIFIGAVVTVITVVFEKLEKYLLRWKH
ncbi:MAG TPA: ABC transporter permease [Bacillota bacterium]|nr:ABC transporter permease [Bacillota bacterium]